MLSRVETSYLIEIRFFGSEKNKAKELIRDLNRELKLERRLPVPHITLVGPLTTSNQRRLISDFKKICENHQNYMEYRVDGFGTFEDTRVLYLNINPGELLDAFRWDLSNQLQKYCTLRPHDYKKEFYFHATLARKLSPEEFERAKRSIKLFSERRFKQFVMRVTLLRKGRILYEYDFFLKRTLTRREALNKRTLSRSFDRLKEYIDSLLPTSAVEVLKFDGNERGFWNRLFGKKRIFLIGDLHLDHKNIIKYCNRPFKSLAEMNEKLIENWNKKVGKRDTVLFLGDMAYGRGSRKTRFWLSKLNGNIIFIKGNHDYSRYIDFKRKLRIIYKDHEFLLAHDTKNTPMDWTGWTIHGHTHNNNLAMYPFINGRNKTINVGAEVLGYSPISLDELLKLNYKEIEVMERYRSLV